MQLNKIKKILPIKPVRVLVVYLISFHILVFAEPEDPAKNRDRVLFKSFHTVLSSSPSIYPDAPNLSYSITGGIWKAAVNSELVTIGGEIGKHFIGNTAGGLIELSNFSTGEPVPWELWRANMGLGILYIYYPNTPTIVNLWVETGYNHESDHVTNLDYYSIEFLEYYSQIDMLYNFDHPNISSFEYVDLSLGITLDLKSHFLFAINPSVRFYPSPINPGGERDISSSWHLGISVEKLFTSHISLYSGFYIETMVHDFDYEANNYRAPDKEGNLSYLNFDCGIRIKSNNESSFIPFFRFMSGNGRGLDFPKRYKGIGGGFKFFM